MQAATCRSLCAQGKLPCTTQIERRQPQGIRRQCRLVKHPTIARYHKARRVACGRLAPGGQIRAQAHRGHTVVDIEIELRGPVRFGTHEQILPIRDVGNSVVARCGKAMHDTCQVVMAYEDRARIDSARTDRGRHVGGGDVRVFVQYALPIGNRPCAASTAGDQPSRQTSARANPIAKLRLKAI